MVYKKIGDKIPSLSSLLLAGVLLAGGCQSNKKETAGSEEPKADKADGKGEEAQKPKSQGAEENTSKPWFSSEKASIVKAFYDYLVDSASLQYLNHPGVPVIDDSALSGKPKDLKVKVQDAYRSIASPKYLKAYPSSLESCLKSLEKSVEQINGDNYYGYASALNKITTAWEEIRGIYTKMMNHIQQGASLDDMMKLKKELDVAYTSLTKSAGAPVFIASTSFNNIKEPQMLTGDQLARFLTGKDKNDKNKTLDKQWDIPALLGRKFNVYTRSASDDVYRNAGSLAYVGTRGAYIKGTWLVAQSKKDKASANKLRNITSLCPKGEVTHYLDELALTELSSANQVGELTGVKPRELNGYHILFSVFKGNEKGDFLMLQQDKKGQCLKLEGNNEKFQEVLKHARGTNEDFAKFLGGHIEAVQELKELFPVPDLRDIEHAILFNTSSRDQLNKAPANKGGGNKLDAANSYKDILSNIQKDSLADKLLVNILTVFGKQHKTVKSSDPTEQQAIATELDEIKNLASNQTNFDASNLSFTQKLVVSIAKELFDHPELLTDPDSNTGKNLLDKVDNIIHAELNLVLVFKENSNYKYTPITGIVKQLIDKIGSALASKHSNSKIAYSNLQSISGGDTGFKVQDVDDAFERAYKDLGAILSAQVSTVFSLKDQSVNYGTFLPNIMLTPADSNKLDEIRLKYWGLSKASGTVSNKAPGA